MGSNYSKMAKSNLFGQKKAKKAKIEKFRNNKCQIFTYVICCNFFRLFGTIGTYIYCEGHYLSFKGHKGHSKAKYRSIL